MLPQAIIQEAVSRALAEDIGAGDITTLSTVDPGRTGRAVMLAKAQGVICGLDLVREVFRQVDSRIIIATEVADGARVTGTRETIAALTGSAASILTGERVALNFIQRMSGIATLTAAYVDAVAGTGARVVDTRKTTPGLRPFEKYAVRVGGAANHRYGLADGVLIKDNHIAAAGGIGIAIELARARASHLMKIEVEVKNLAEVAEALAAGADVILLDNMSVDTIREAVGQIGARAIVEASGGVNLATVRAIAESGVDLISVGALTHSVTSLDISLDLVSP